MKMEVEILPPPGWRTRGRFI